MVESHATVPTLRAQRYAKQLVSHLGRKCEVADDPAGQWVILPGGSARCLIAAAENHLTLSALAATAEHLARVEEVVGGHLERFGLKDELHVTWVPQASAPR